MFDNDTAFQLVETSKVLFYRASPSFDIEDDNMRVTAYTDSREAVWTSSKRWITFANMFFTIEKESFLKTKEYSFGFMSIYDITVFIP